MSNPFTDDHTSVLFEVRMAQDMLERNEAILECWMAETDKTTKYFFSKAALAALQELRQIEKLVDELT
jgi:hypothetical protein